MSAVATPGADVVGALRQGLEPLAAAVRAPGQMHPMLADLKARLDAAAAGPVRVIPMEHLLARIWNNQGCSFTMHGERLPADVVFAPEMFQPILAWAVHDAYVDLLGQQPGCALRVDKNSLFGARSVVPLYTARTADFFRLAFFRYVGENLFGLRPHAQIELAPMHELLREQFAALIEGCSQQNGEIPWPMPVPTH